MEITPKARNRGLALKVKDRPLIRHKQKTKEK